MSSDDHPPKHIRLTPEQAKNVRPGPIRHETLSPQLTEWSRSLYNRVGKYTVGSFEKWELDFLRDMFPASELGQWEMIARAVATEQLKRPEADTMHLIRELNAISLGASFDDETAEIVSLTALYETTKREFSEELKALGLTTADDVALHCVERAAGNL